MALCCNCKLDYHYYGEKILVYKSIHEFYEIPEIHSNIIEMIANEEIGYQDLYNRICTNFEVDSSDEEIKRAFEIIIEKLTRLNYIVQNEKFEKQRTRYI